jgi:hypothetical protein
MDMAAAANILSPEELIFLRLLMLSGIITMITVWRLSGKVILYSVLMQEASVREENS